MDSAALDLLLEKMWRGLGRDFREYKRGTIVRRLERRLLATGARTYRDYLQFLETHSAEYQQLADYLTITVSSFFRSAYTFQQIARLVLPRLMGDKRARRQGGLSFWSAACARGEEPYSLAIVLADFLADRLDHFPVSIYATDVSQPALHQAQAGVYAAGELAGLPASMREKYFTRQGAGYTVNQNIREMVHFSYFDLVSTPAPFSHVDGIFCCRVLIYLQRQLQERVLEMLYHSLAVPGYLILGEAETPTPSLSQKLECLDSKAKIYQKINRA